MGGRRGGLMLVTAEGAAPVSPGPALFEEMLAGWRRQQQARRLSGPLIGMRERVVRRFAASTGCWPWQWTAAQAESWLASGGWAHSTARAYQGALSLFLDYVCDPRYGWMAECEQRAGAVPVQVFHERNTTPHAAEYEGRPAIPSKRGHLRLVDSCNFFVLFDYRTPVHFVSLAFAGARARWSPDAPRPGWGRLRLPAFPGPGAAGGSASRPGLACTCTRQLDGSRLSRGHSRP